MISFPLAIVKRNFSTFSLNTIYFLNNSFKEKNKRRRVVVVLKKNVRVVVSFSFVVCTASVSASTCK